MVLAVVSRLVEVRLWRAGRLSDRTTAVMLLARFPIVSLLAGVIFGASVPAIAGLTIVALLPAILFYRFVLDLLRDEARARAMRL
jgi:prepilin signal peptidase PulO-like enzyme (type II secretory pathway)